MKSYILRSLSLFWATVFLIAMLPFEADAAIVPAAENFTRVWNDLMKKPYDKRIRPLYGENALFVRVSFNLETILDVNERASELSVRIVFRQTWLEPRLTFSPAMVPNDTVKLNADQTKLIWTPDTVFSNQKRSETQEGHENILLTSEGLITTSVRLLLTTDCPMRYDYFPFDVQTCNIKIGSFSQDRRELLYEWSWRAGEVRVEPSPLVSNRFDLLSFDTQTGWIPGPSNKSSFSALTIRLHFNSNWKNYLTSVFTPITFFSAISLLSLWLFTPVQGVLLNLLNIALMNIFVIILTGEEERPVISQRTAMDQYISLCFFFVFASLLVDFLNAYFEKHPKAVLIEEEEVSDIPLEPKVGGTDEETGIECDSSKEDVKPCTPLAVHLLRIRDLGQSISERHAHWILLTGFICLNFFYWAAYMNLQNSRVERVGRH